MAVTTDCLTWLEQTVAELVLGAEENRLADYGGQPAFSAPVLGVADGRDPLFARLRSVVSARHFLPAELLARQPGAPAEPETVRVVAWALPFAEEVRASNRQSRWPSRLYSLARNNGGALNLLVRDRLAQALRAEGFAAVAPALEPDYMAFRSAEYTYSSSWSERHVAYAAGLGRFGLNAAMITPVGINVRLGSIVTDMPLPVTPRRTEEWRAPCLASEGRACGRCMARCPVSAISGRGLDKARCATMRDAVRERYTDEYSRELRLLKAQVAAGGRRAEGYSLGCALCQCGVPCEGRFPDFAALEADPNA